MQHPFLHRLRLERKLIRVVNSRLPPSFPSLNGTSSAAIENWFHHLVARDVGELDFWRMVCELLNNTGKRLRLHSDASHRGFAEDRLLDDDQTSALIREIEVLVTTVSHADR